MSVTRRTVDCPCGNNLYEAGYDEAVVNKVWRCSNCERETPRKTCHRSTNHLRAIKSYLALREAWKPVDAALDALVSAGLAQGGALLVHSSVFNYHLKQLVDFEKPSNFAVKYHTTQAQADMAKAKAFINERTVQETV